MIKHFFYLVGFILSILLFLVSCDDLPDLTKEEELSTVGEDIRQESVWLDSLCSNTFAGRRVGSHGNYLAYEYLISEAQRMGFSPKTMKFVHESGIELRNIVVSVEGEIKDSLFVIGAHFDGQYESSDTVFYQAANDNGSGVVTALSVLDSLSRGEAPRYTTIVCFWDGEEANVSPAFKGSSHFVKNIENIGSVVLYVNIDAMGHDHDNAMVLGWYGGHSPFRVHRAVKWIIEDGFFDYSILERGRGEGSSDYVSFSRTGIPYISFTDITLSCDHPIHSARDTKDAVDVSRLCVVRDLTIKILMSY